MPFTVITPGFMISHTREQWNRQGKIISQAGMDHQREGFLFHDALKKCTIGPSTVMISSDLYGESGGFREDMEIAEDYEYWLRLTAFHNVAFLDKPLTVKRAGHGDQLSEKYGQIEIFRISGLRDLVDRKFFPEDLMPLAARELSGNAVSMDAAALSGIKRKRGRSILISPDSTMYWLNPEGKSRNVK